MGALEQFVRTKPPNKVTFVNERTAALWALSVESAAHQLTTLLLAYAATVIRISHLYHQFTTPWSPLPMVFVPCVDSTMRL